MSERKNQSNFQKTAFLLVDIHIMIELCLLTFREKVAFNFETSLAG
jgi:hypothetical protein